MESGIDWRAVTEGKQDSSAQSSDYLQARGGLREGGRHCQWDCWELVCGSVLPVSVVGLGFRRSPW